MFLSVASPEGGLEAVDAPIRSLRNPLVGSIAGLEVQVCSPVVGEIVSRPTCGTRSELRDVRRGHRRIEGIAADNLVHMGGRSLARIDEPVMECSQFTGLFFGVWL